MSLSASSFRDPASCVEIKNGKLCRVITPAYEPVFTQLKKSGLYKRLADNYLIIPHAEIGKTIYPEIVYPITYPYEWSFSQLKKAALVTLEIARISLDYGLMLKDASAFNIQYHHGNWLLIDTGSFMLYNDWELWPAYGQFLRHFVCPLVSCHYRDVEALKTLITRIDGLPVAETSKRLPAKSWFNPNVVMHIHSHRMVKSSATGGLMSKTRLIALIENLTNFVRGLNYKCAPGWVDYEPDVKYATYKKAVAENILHDIEGTNLLDIGTNRGEYSELAYQCGYHVVSIDRDHDCIENARGLYLPLVVDITNPTPAIGWANKERTQFTDRFFPDVVMALAVIHHICVGNNIPLAKVAENLAQITRQYALVEWVEPDDYNAAKIGAHRIFPQYNRDVYLQAFFEHFELVRKVDLTNWRTLCLWRKKPVS